MISLLDVSLVDQRPIGMFTAIMVNSSWFGSQKRGIVITDSPKIISSVTSLWSKNYWPSNESFRISEAWPAVGGCICCCYLYSVDSGILGMYTACGNESYAWNAHKCDKLYRIGRPGNANNIMKCKNFASECRSGRIMVRNRDLKSKINEFCHYLNILFRLIGFNIRDGSIKGQHLVVADGKLYENRRVSLKVIVSESQKDLSFRVPRPLFVRLQPLLNFVSSWHHCNSHITKKASRPLSRNARWCRNARLVALGIMYPKVCCKFHDGFCKT